MESSKSLKEKVMNRHVLLAVILIVALMSTATPGSAQRFQQLPNTSVYSVAPGAVSVWGLQDPSTASQYTGGQFRQISNPFQVADISVGGGSVMQFDEVWATDSNGLVYQWDNYAQTFHQVAGSLQDVVVGEGYSACHPYEVWGTDANHEVWRFNYCTHNFDLIGGFYNGLSTGSGEVWALNAYNQVFRFNFSTNQFDLMPGALTQISVGAGGVWGVFTDFHTINNVWQFDPSTQTWQQLPGPIDMIKAGSDGVFGFHNEDSFGGSKNAYRLNPSTRTWTLVYSVTGAFSDIGQIAAGTGAGTWMIGGLTEPTYYYLSF
jgi:Tectonin domain